jgi:tRNA pseudouridine55 synthase
VALNGIFIIDKPEGITSHDVVQALRKKFKMSKVGHLGTLDPMATGVLPVAVGKATRMLQFIPNTPKEYEGEIRFGFATDTYDRNGSPTSVEVPLEGDLHAGMAALVGALDQVPPPFSAKKIGGVPAYKLARRNQAPELKASRVEVETFEILSLNPPLLRFRVVCSPGTYVRSLAHDLGQLVGCGAHLTQLRRTRSGEYRIHQAVGLETLSKNDLIPMESLLSTAPRLLVSDMEEIKIVHGNTIAGEGSVDVARIFNKRGEFLAIASIENGFVRPRVVLTSINSDRSNTVGCILEKENQS